MRQPKTPRIGEAKAKQKCRASQTGAIGKTAASYWDGTGVHEGSRVSVCILLQNGAARQEATP